MESGEAQVRAALSAIPLARLRAAGLLDILLALASSDGTASPVVAAVEESAAVDAMDVESLIDSVLDREHGSAP